MATTRPRYRYITMGLADLDTPIRGLPLRPANGLTLYSAAWRVIVPDSAKLTGIRHCQYSATDDAHRVRELSPVPMVKVDGRWQKMPSLSSLPVHKWPDRMVELGYHVVDCSAGFAAAQPFKVIYYRAAKELPDILGSSTQYDWDETFPTEAEARDRLQKANGNLLERTVKQDGQVHRHWYDFVNKCWVDHEGRRLSS